MCFSETEAIGPLALHRNIRKLFRGAPLLHSGDWVVIYGQGEIFIGAVWSHIQGLGSLPWPGRGMQSNPVIGQSQYQAFPVKAGWMADGRAPAFPSPSFELFVTSSDGERAFTPTRCWQLPNREDGSTSVRREELCAVGSISHEYLGATP